MSKSVVPVKLHNRYFCLLSKHVRILQTVNLSWTNAITNVHSPTAIHTDWHTFCWRLEIFSSKSPVLKRLLENGCILMDIEYATHCVRYSKKKMYRSNLQNKSSLANNTELRRFDWQHDQLSRYTFFQTSVMTETSKTKPFKQLHATTHYNTTGL